MSVRLILLITVIAATPRNAVIADQRLDLTLRLQSRDQSKEPTFQTQTREESWDATETAIIVCDVWDYHHCLNAVRRIEEFVPRLNEVLIEARRRGVTIIHSPSDCMDAYADHPSRKRAKETPKADFLPNGIQSWCSKIPAEEGGTYPIDQSDGGEDDDPEEHAAWAEKLKSLGRDPSMPWKKQTDMIVIDQSVDFISDRGDEVWNILADQGIHHVILTGVHTNMCVLGRPFGLRQMARNGKNVVLMRDMTDTMYNPQRWPYVSHFEGTRRIISHIERFICPTITSDQLIGGQPFRFAGDSGEEEPSESPTTVSPADWTTISVPEVMDDTAKENQTRWYRCIVHSPMSWNGETIRMKCPADSVQAWINGKPLTGEQRKSGLTTFAIDSDALNLDDHNLIALRVSGARLQRPLVIHAGQDKLVLSGRWQTRSGDDPSYANMPLPAKFGGASDIVFRPEEPLWTPRALTRVGEFTEGIEGPACDSEGNVFAVNYSTQGTIGRIRPNGLAEIFVRLPEGSIGNGIRFAPDGSFFVADYTRHNVLRIDPATREIAIHAHEPRMNQPNDLTLAPDGKTLYASDPDWSDGTGNVWRIDEDGQTTLLASDLGTTNGIEVSPDGTTLFVNESKQRNVWAFTITPKRELSGKRLIRRFEDHGFDGMRCDVDGNLYITRYGKGTVVKMTPDGEILREIPVLGNRPSNICFGGPDRRTAYVTEVDSRRLISFRVDRPGRN